MVESPRKNLNLHSASGSDGSHRTTRWMLAQEGSRQSFAVPLAFARRGLLRLFYTDIWCRFGRDLLRRGPKGFRALAGRFHPEIPAERTVSFDSRAILFRTLQHFQHGKQSMAELGESFCRFGRWFALRVRAHLEGLQLDSEIDRFFCFDTNSLEALELLKSRGVFTVLDHVDPGKVHEDLVIAETELWPGWQQKPDRMPDCYWERRKAEWNLADCVLVNSEWAKEALAQQGVPIEKMIVVPVGIDLSNRVLPPPVEAPGDLKVLWLGNMTLGKGIQYLVQAARLLERRNIQILVAGPIWISQEVLRSFPSNIKILGRVTRDRLADIYRAAHVFVLPTISDGFAVTQLEAMAHGLPVIVTPNCGRVVTHGRDGFLVPARDGKALAEAIARLEADRGLVRKMSRRALETVHLYDLPSNADMICNAAENLFQRKRADYSLA